MNIDKILKETYAYQQGMPLRDIKLATALAFEHAHHEWDDGWNPILHDAMVENFGRGDFRGKDDRPLSYVVVGNSGKYLIEREFEKMAERLSKERSEAIKGLRK